ncbi:MAG TPA: hypothetical protein VMT88_06280 [Actinomycetes bacterium]|nr:hypothetical protein [Actinomycetes bacterium]
MTASLVPSETPFTRRDARRLVTSLVAYFFSFGVVVWLFATPYVFLAVAMSLLIAAIALFSYVNLLKSEMAPDERPTGWLLYWQSRLFRKLLVNREWRTRLIQATGWPTTSVYLATSVALGFAIGCFCLLFLVPTLFPGVS